MKKIILILVLFSGYFTQAQPIIPADSSKMMVGRITMESNDWESVFHILSSRPVWNDIEDSLKVKYRIKPNSSRPKNAEPVSIDSSITQAWITLTQVLLTSDYEEVSPFYNRVTAAIKAIAGGSGNAFLQRKITALEADAKKKRDNQKVANRDLMTGKN